MKKQLVIILIVIEIIGILAIGLLYSKWYSSYYVYSIEIPQGMQLTTNKSLELFTLNGTVNISEGETIVPIGAVEPYVYFTLEQGDSMLSSTWDNFVEQEQLEELQKIADIKSEATQKLIRTKGAIISTIIVICWLGIVGVASYLLVKKKRIKAIFIGHGISIFIIFSSLVFIVLNI